MSKRQVLLSIHDYPKRSMMSRERVVVEAETDDEAIAEGERAAKVLWPGCKVRAFDVRKAGDNEIISVPHVAEKRPVLKARASA